LRKLPPSVQNLIISKNAGIRTEPSGRKGEEMKGYLIMKDYLYWFVLAAALVVLAGLGFGSIQFRNGVCSRIVEEAGTRKDRVVFIIEDLCGSSGSSDKTDGR